MTHGNAQGPIAQALKIRPGEGGAVVLSGLFFFLLLFGYFLIRPVREAMGVQRSMDDLRWLFVTTCAVSLLVTLAFGSVVSITNRARFIPIATRVIIACLLGFAAVIWTTGGHPHVRVSYKFYVWLSIINLFMTSVFWAFMADVWTLEQGKRLFPAIAVGGTIGALLGSLFAWQLAEAIGPSGQMLLAAALFEASVWTMKLIDRKTRPVDAPGDHPRRAAPRIGGQWWDGALAMLRSPYLLGIGAWIALMAVSNTLIYFTGARLVSDASEELERRVALFAQLDMWTQAATLLVQLFVTARLIRWFGLGLTLAVMPLVTVGGFTTLAWVSAIDGIEPWQIFGVFAAFNAVHRATRYAVARPARETLFSVIPASEKYKAKPIVDVFLYRGGDVAGAGVDKWLAGSTLLIGGVAMAAAPLAVFWGGLSVWLAWQQRQKADRSDHQKGLEHHSERAGTPAPSPGPVPGGAAQ